MAQCAKRLAAATSPGRLRCSVLLRRCQLVRPQPLPLARHGARVLQLQQRAVHSVLQVSGQLRPQGLAQAGALTRLDDPRLLKRSLKKEAKLKAKKAVAWQERLTKQKEQQQAKQQK